MYTAIRQVLDLGLTLVYLSIEESSDGDPDTIISLELSFDSEKIICVLWEFGYAEHAEQLPTNWTLT